MPCVSFHVALQFLNIQERNFDLQLSEPQVWHSLSVSLDDNISLVCVQDKLSTVMSGVVGDGPDLLEDLERNNCHNPSFVA
jgi:hypothetical protein